jgi:hypothetical protein
MDCGTVLEPPWEWKSYGQRHRAPPHTPGTLDELRGVVKLVERDRAAQIEYMRGHLEHADAWVRPIGMEALVRSGVPREMVEGGLQATEAEVRKLDELLSRPDECL